MSLSHSFDAWLEDHGEIPRVEVVPDHACQDFQRGDGVIILPNAQASGQSHISPEMAAVLVRDLLG